MRKQEYVQQPTTTTYFNLQQPTATTYYYLLLPPASESDYRATIGSGKHVAIILRISFFEISCGSELRNLYVFWHFSAKLGQKCQNTSDTLAIVDFFFARNPNPKLPQYDSHIFPRPMCCPRFPMLRSPGHDSEVLRFAKHIDGIKGWR